MLFDQRKLGPLEELLGGLAPAAAVMLNFEISLASATYSEESATLARTLLPFVDRVTDYRFLGSEAGFIASRFLSSLPSPQGRTGYSVTRLRGLRPACKPGGPKDHDDL